MAYLWIPTVSYETGNDPGPRLPSRVAIAIQPKKSSQYMLIESAAMTGRYRGEEDDYHGPMWILYAGCFTNDVTNPGPRRPGRVYHVGKTYYMLLSSGAGGYAAALRLEKTLR